MFARVSTYAGPHDRIDEAVAAFDDDDRLLGLEGLEDAFLFVDRSAGRMMTITLWADEGALRATSSAADDIRTSDAGAGGQVVTSVAAYEVALHARPEIEARRAGV